MVLVPSTNLVIHGLHNLTHSVLRFLSPWPHSYRLTVSRAVGFSKRGSVTPQESLLSSGLCPRFFFHSFSPFLFWRYFFPAQIRGPRASSSSLSYPDHLPSMLTFLLQAGNQTRSRRSRRTFAWTYGSRMERPWESDFGSVRGH